ncbi:MAG: hypothetical protein HY740_06335 [Chloroflexi bacterium]|nr:hypothetical protein [Chloroflexota bacterium]
MRSSTTNYVFGCSVPEPEVPLFGAFVKAPAQRGQSEVIGLIYNIAIEDDPFVRQMIATPDLDEAYIQDQRVNRQVPIEVSVLAIGYRNGGGFTHDLPPQPPITLDRISPCDAAEIKQFTERLDYLRLILFAPDVPADELIAVSLRLAADCQPAEDRDRFLRNAGRELAKLLNRDLARLEKLLKRLKT